MSFHLADISLFYLIKSRFLHQIHFLQGVPMGALRPKVLAEGLNPDYLE